MKIRNGFTLIEFVICLALVGFVISGAGVLLNRIQALEMDAKKKTETDQQRMELAKYLRLAFSQAIVLEKATITNSENASQGIGKVSDFCFGASSCSAPDLSSVRLVPVAYFWRETQLGESSPAQSLFQATGIFFQNPTPDQAGVVVITPTMAGNNLTANSNNLKFGNVVEFEIKEIKTVCDAAITSPTDPQYCKSGSAPFAKRVTSVQVRWVQRWQKEEIIDRWGWCPKAHFATFCAGKSERFNDLETVINIPLRNNWLGINPSREVNAGEPTDANQDYRLFDRVYFFQTETRVKE